MLSVQGASGGRAESVAPPVSYPLVGVVGGMGPLASTELLRTVYALGGDMVDEQHAPRILLWSDPLVVDRTEAVESGRLDLLAGAVEQAVAGLVDAGARRVVVACLTAHTVLHRLPVHLAERCASLVELVFDRLAADPRPHLLLCTRGTARSGVFHEHPGAAPIRHLLVGLDAVDQELLHEHIYRLKRGGDPGRTADLLCAELLPRYDVAGFLAGCTELHLVTRELAARGVTVPCIDPMLDVARRIVGGVL